MKIAFYTLGCKTNQFETQALERLCLRRGHQVVPFDQEADAYVINTCTVTAISDKKSRNAARRAKRRNPQAILAVCGCYAQVKPDEVRQLCGADLVLGSSEKSKLVELLEQAAEGVPVTYRIPPALQKHPFDPLPAGGLLGHTRALLKVQDGCQNFCAYCMIPYARGPSRSIPLSTAVDEAARLASDGYRELVITGIEISSYGLDLPDKPGLDDLIAGICEAAPETRIRLGSLEPRTITRAFAQRLSVYPNLCPQFHLSLQSGCDKTLRDMNRRYDTARYLESCRILREYFPGCAITTDLIVGFPGEAEQDFAQTLEFLKQCSFAQVHIFPYSRRTGTRAAQMPHQVPRAVKEQRAAQAADVCAALRADYLSLKLGKTLSVLFEQQTEVGVFSGYSMEYCEVRVQYPDLRNQVRSVKITGIQNGYLLGTVCE